MARAMRSSREPIVESSGNVFEDLGFKDAETRHTKVRLAAAINGIIGRLDRTQADAANQLGISQPKVSALLNYKLEGFSVERLMHFLTALDQDLEIVIREKPRSRRVGKIVVTGGPTAKKAARITSSLLS
jgi:predicted XRE-type DNA-binding protein